MQLTKVEPWERVLGVYIDTYLTWNEHIDTLRRKLLQRIAILDELFKLQKRCARLILDSPRDARSHDGAANA